MNFSELRYVLGTNMWLCSIMGHVTFSVPRDIVNETCQCPYNTWKVHFRALLIKNN